MPGIATIGAMPGIGTQYDALGRRLFWSTDRKVLLPGGLTINGALSRDPFNTGDVSVLQAGMPMGRITATGLYAPAVLGTLGNAFTGAAGQMYGLTARMIAEIVRRIGATGTFNVIGPPTAAGTVRTLLATYTATGGGTPTNEVQTATPDAASTAGSYRISITKSDGSRVTTAAIAFDATLATAQAAVTAALGSAGCILSSAGSAAPFSAGPIALVFTFSGTSYAALDQPMVSIDISLLTGVATMTIVQTTRGLSATMGLTVNALNVNEVQRITFNIASTGGNIAIRYYDPTAGDWRLTGPAAWSATDATYISNLQAQLDLATGVANAIVATAPSATDTDLGFVLTFSGTGFAGLSHPLVQVVTYPTSSTQSTVTRTTAGQDGRFVVGSIIAPIDGSQVPRCLIAKEDGIPVADRAGTSYNVQFQEACAGGCIQSNQILGYPTADASLQSYLKLALKTFGYGYLFDDDF